MYKKYSDISVRASTNHSGPQTVVQIGPDYGYFPNPAKTCLLVKDAARKTASDIFTGTGISITCEGKKYLGAPLGTDAFVHSFIHQQISTWEKELKLLSKFAVTQPHAAYAAFTHGFTSKWTYLTRVVPNVSDLFAPLEAIIRQIFLPSVTGQSSSSDSERELLALPVRLGGLGIISPTKLSSLQYNASLKSLCDLILKQSTTYLLSCTLAQQDAKKTSSAARHLAEKDSHTHLLSTFPLHLWRILEASSEKGSSSGWLTALPLTSHGFALHKGDF